MKNKYPRVLIIYHSRINKADQHGVSIRGWFGDWPKENMAQIYSGGEVGEEVFCSYNFRLGQKERRFGKYFYKLKGSSLGQSSYPLILNKRVTKINKHSLWSLLMNKISIFFVNTGIWELFFKPILSDEMIQFIEKFNPQIIYCQGYQLTYTWLPVMIHNKFHIPICFQTGDDWPSSLYKDSFLSIVIKPIVNRSIMTLLSCAKARLANGKLMAEVFKKRYGFYFEPLMMCDDLSRFRSALPHRVVSNDSISIVYAGGLGHKRWASIIELCKAAELLRNENYKIIVTVFATEIPHEAISILRDQNNLQILHGPSHEELPSLLKGADILYLPETFDLIVARTISLSISTKAHLYMLSEKPILMYASPITGTMNYSLEERWGYNVQEHNLTTLANAIRNLLVDEGLQIQLIERGLEVASINHDQQKIRTRFLEILNRIL